jgi:hypothetical protein
MKELKRIDPNSVITRYFLERLIRNHNIMALKYGNAWLLNLDELYAYLSGKTFSKKTNKGTSKTHFVSSEDICRLFVQTDPDTIIRKPNLRRFIRSNEIRYFTLPSGKWRIDLNNFLSVINPNGISNKTEPPRMRWHDDSVRNFSKLHPNLHATIEKVEFSLLSDEIFKTKNGSRWIINYDQLEKQVIEDLT